jgi:type I restriction enzyme M protein
VTLCAWQGECLLGEVLAGEMGLGPNLFYNSPMEAYAIVCRTRKLPERRGWVLFVSAVAEVTLERAQRFLEREHIERIVGAYRAYQDVAGFARGAALDEIWAHGANLNIPLYMPPAGNGNGDGATDKPLSRVIAECEQSSRRLWQSMEQLWETLSAVG